MRKMILVFLVPVASFALIWPLLTRKNVVNSKAAQPLPLNLNEPDLSPQYSIYEWDDADSHKWTGAGWGSDEPSSLNWGSYYGRDCLEVRWDYAAWLGYIHTDSFPDENWEAPIRGLRADVYVISSENWTDIGIEPKDHYTQTIELLWGNAINLTPNQWHTVSWYFSEEKDYQAVSGLVFKLDQLGNSATRVYMDNLRLIVNPNTTEDWDDMDDSSRWWFYGGNWHNWSWKMWGLEPVSHQGENPSTPAGSIYLEWDYDHGCISCTLSASAEVGTSSLADLSDWSNFNRISADVKISDANVPLSVFLWDEEGDLAPTDCRGFGAPTQRVQAGNTWQTLTWNFPWPPCFDNTGIDQVKFVVDGIDTFQTGTLFIDNIRLISDTLPAPQPGLSYIFENFNDEDIAFNDFSGNWGVLNSHYISATFDTTVYQGSWGASQKITYTLPTDSFAGVWQSLWGHSDYTQTQSLDLTDFFGSSLGIDRDIEQIQFWVRGSGTTTATHNIKIELKDVTGDFDRTAYRYITIDDIDTTWQPVVLDADVTNADFWSYNGSPPDPTRMKQMVFVIESYFNNPTGTFYLDDIHFVDADDVPFDPDAHSEDEFLDLVSERTFLYFMDWYNPDTGLFQDRSTFPDLYSTASTGFGLTALAIGESRGWVVRDQAVEMITTTLHTLYDGHSPSDTATDVISGTNGYRGFYYHFLGTDANRKINESGEGSELSPVDTAILMAGVLTVREYFKDVPEIVDLADALYERVEWDWMLDSANNWFYLAWKPELDAANGYTVTDPDGGFFSQYYWNYYTDEVVLINLLAIGSPTHPVSRDVFYAWARDWGTYAGHTFIQSWNGSLFTYFFAHLWVDFGAFGEDQHPLTPVNWWENSKQAAWANWQFTVDHHNDVACEGDEDYTTYSEVSWGLTAAEGPGGAYHAYGALPAVVPPDHDGTIAPYAAGMALSVLPEKSIPALKNYFQNTDLWRYRFGFGDAYNLDPPTCDGPWYNHALFGIDQGPLLISIENYRTGLVWETFGQNAYIRNALCAIGSCIYLPVILRDSP